MSSTSDIGHNATPQKSKRSRISRLLRRADSSSSSVGQTRSPDASPERNNSKRSRVGTLFRHPGSSSSSLSVASDAEPEDAATRAKRSALRRSLSALSSKARHGASHRSSLDSEPLALDTRAASPGPDALAEHKMLSPVVESPIADSPGGPHIFSPMLVVSNPQQDAPSDSADVPVATPPAPNTTNESTQAPSAEAETAAPVEESKPPVLIADEQSGSTVSSEASAPPAVREASSDESSVDAPRAPTLSNSSVMSDSDSNAPWEMEYEHLGWSMQELPGDAVYFTHPAKGIVSDVDLRRDGAMREVFEFLAGPHVTPLPGWELWLRDTGNLPSRASDYSFVNHELRLVSFTPQPTESTAAGQVLYWMYVEKHPAHCAPIILSEKMVSEAHDALTWEGEKMLPSGNRIDVPIFSQEERQQFSASLKSFNDNSTSAEMTAVTRDVARILLRQWQQDQWHELGGVDQHVNREVDVDEPKERAVPVPFSDQYTLGLRDVVMVAVAAGMVVGCAALLGPAAAFVMVLREVRRR
ncbi:hypothetical protein PENSPDRAFT_752338 [Peniophora sp. CONT]|nr:hypothetical protein PENSPDRAFT_752338 [Peniophora sp. CONT]